LIDDTDNKTIPKMRTATLFLVLATFALGAPLGELDHPLNGAPKDVYVDCDMRNLQCSKWALSTFVFILLSYWHAQVGTKVITSI
jgi:hypothetical protein